MSEKRLHGDGSLRGGSSVGGSDDITPSRKTMGGGKFYANVKNSSNDPRQVIPMVDRMKMREKNENEEIEQIFSL